MKRYLIFIMAMQCLCACGIFTRYERPRLDVKEETGTELFSWREMFTDPSLQALIDTALVHGADLQTALLGVEEAQAALGAARLAFLPSVSAQADASSESVRAYGTASWELDFFGKKRNAYLQAGASLEGKEAYAQAVRTRLIASVAESYYTLLLLDRQLEISRATLVNWETTVSVLETLKAAGKSNDIAVLQAQAKKIMLEGSVVTLSSSIARTENALCTLVGIPCAEIPRGSLEGQSFSLEEVPLGYVASRPDIKVAEAALTEAFYATNAARSAFYPSITLSGSAGWNFSAEALISSALASLTAPVFSRGANKAALRAAEARQKAATVAFRQTLLQAANEVNDALADCRTARERIELGTAQCEALSAAVEKIQLMMRYSSTNYLEVITAQQSLLDAELSLEQDRVNLLRGYIALYKALGGGTF